ncbi:HAD domain-containing protein [Candidatus Dojkabacteria bacterium]|jgi:hypothetical protein|nr:HAD domain-containing protein [Candidatus Dojkabacteria bacterium]
MICSHPNFIFTDIDGVLNPNFKPIWNRRCVDVYNKICSDFDLKPIITSTWRIKYTIPELQKIFNKQGIVTKICSQTPILMDHRGLEIDQWLMENSWNKYVVIDDSVSQITPYVNNVVKCDGWVGLTYEHYDIIKKLLS